MFGGVVLFGGQAIKLIKNLSWFEYFNINKYFYLQLIKLSIIFIFIINDI